MADSDVSEIAPRPRPYKKLEQAHAALKLFGKDARYKRLEGFWLRYLGLHYDVDDLWNAPLKEWDEDTDSEGRAVPLSQRKPSIRTGFGSSLVDRQVTLLIGEGQLPTVRVVDPDGATLEAATDAWQRLADRVNFWGLIEEAVPPWLSTGSSCIAAYVPKPKRLSVTSYYSFQAEPVLVSDLYETSGRRLPISKQQKEMLQVVAEREGLDDQEIVFLQTKSVWIEEDPTDFGLQRVWLSRRDFWPDRVITYEDVDVTNWDLTQKLPSGNPQIIKHDLGFVPAVWMRNGRVKDEIDGVSMFAGSGDALDAIDRMRSQTVRGATYHGDGTLGPKDSEAAGTLNGLGDEIIEVGVKRVLPVPMEVVGIDGNGQRVQIEVTRELKEDVQNRMGVRLQDPEKISGALAASALEQLDQTTVASTQKRRKPLGYAITTLAKYILRLARKAGLEKPADLPEDPHAWNVVAEWPAVYAANVHDKLEAANAGAAAKGSITEKTITRYVAGVWGSADPDQEADHMEEERKKRDEELLAAVAQSVRQPAGAGTPPKPRDGQSGQPPKA